MGRAGPNVPTFNTSTEVCAQSRAQAQPDGDYSTLGNTAEDWTTPSQHHHLFSFSLSFNFILSFDLCSSSHYTIPLDIEPNKANKRLVQRKKLHLYVFILTRFHSTWLQVDFIYLRAVGGVMQRLCFPFAPCHFLFTNMHARGQQVELALAVNLNLYNNSAVQEWTVKWDGFMKLTVSSVSCQTESACNQAKEACFHSIQLSFIPVSDLPSCFLSLFTPSQNWDLDERNGEVLSGIGEEMDLMEGIACLLSHGRIEILKLRPEGSTLSNIVMEGKSRGTQEGAARVNGKHCRWFTGNGEESAVSHTSSAWSDWPLFPSFYLSELFHFLPPYISIPASLLSKASSLLYSCFLGSFCFLLAHFVFFFYILFYFIFVFMFISVEYKNTKVQQQWLKRISTKLRWINKYI